MSNRNPLNDGLEEDGISLAQRRVTTFWPMRHRPEFEKMFAKPQRRWAIAPAPRQTPSDDPVMPDKPLLRPLRVNQVFIFRWMCWHPTEGAGYGVTAEEAYANYFQCARIPMPAARTQIGATDV